MGVFTQRPEDEPDEWAGLPAEPRDPQSAAERLPDAPEGDPFAIGLGDGLGSVEIPLPRPEH